MRGDLRPRQGRACSEIEEIGHRACLVVCGKLFSKVGEGAAAAGGVCAAELVEGVLGDLDGCVYVAQVEVGCGLAAEVDPGSAGLGAVVVRVVVVHGKVKVLQCSAGLAE